MLDIGQRQYEALGAAAFAAYPAALVRHIEEAHPEVAATLADEDLRRRVDHGIARARERGLSDPNAIAAFVSLMFVLGPGYDRHAAFDGLLSPESVTGNRWLARLTEIPARAFGEASDASEAAWSLALASTAPAGAR